MSFPSPDPRQPRSGGVSGGNLPPIERQVDEQRQMATLQLAVAASLHPDATGRLAAIETLQRNSPTPRSVGALLQSLADPATVVAAIHGLRTVLNSQPPPHRLLLTLTYFAVDGAVVSEFAEEAQAEFVKQLEALMNTVPRQISQSVQAAIKRAGPDWWKTPMHVVDQCSPDEAARATVTELVSSQAAIAAYRLTARSARMQALSEASSLVSDPRALAALTVFAPPSVELWDLPAWQGTPLSEVLTLREMRTAIFGPEETVRHAATSSLAAYAPREQAIAATAHELLNLIATPNANPHGNSRYCAVTHAIAFAPGVHAPELAVRVIREALRVAIEAPDIHVRGDNEQLALESIDRLPGSAFGDLIRSLATTVAPPPARRAGESSPEHLLVQRVAGYAVSLITTRRLTDPTIAGALVDLASRTFSTELADRITEAFAGLAQTGAPGAELIVARLQEPPGLPGRDTLIVNLLRMVRTLPRGFFRELTEPITERVIGLAGDTREDLAIRAAAIEALATTDLLSLNRATIFLQEVANDPTLKGAARHHLRSIARRFNLRPPSASS